jgi:3-oxoacyl-[acyl-carrier-protein] synthase III
MLPSLPFRARIAGTGGYAPPRVVTNEELAKTVDTSDEWITSRTGIKTRHLLDYEGQMGTADMGEHAARRALEAAGMAADELDLIIVATVTPDMRLPSTAALLQHRLGATRAAGFDVAAACAGSLFALSIAERFVASGSHKKALVVGGETMTTITNWSDRGTCVLMGDAAGAMVLVGGPSDGPGFVDCQLHLDGSQWEAIHIPKGGSKSPLTAQDILEKQDRMVMNGREVYKFAVRALPKAAEDILARNGLSTGDVTHVVSHQANMRILEAVSERLSIPLERWVINIDRYGNTSSASSLMTFDEGLREGRIQPGDLVLMLSIGAGLAWGSALYRA